MKELTLEEMTRLARNAQERIVLTLLRGKFGFLLDYSGFADLVDVALTGISDDLTARRHNLQDSSEDGISDQVAFGLKQLGFSAVREASSNGHCDITVSGIYDHIILVEAKIYSDYGKLLGGYEQLLNRYSTGLASQNRGIFLIYFKTEAASNTMREWDHYLRQVHTEAVTEFIGVGGLLFLSKEPHPATGVDYMVRHVAVPLYHAPTDDRKMPKRVSIAAAAKAAA